MSRIRIAALLSVPLLALFVAIQLLLPSESALESPHSPTLPHQQSLADARFTPIPGVAVHQEVQELTLSNTGAGSDNAAVGPLERFAVEGSVELPYPDMMQGFGARISLRCGETALTATSRPDGTFSFTNVPAAACDVEVTAPGHLTAKRNVVVVAVEITILPPVRLLIGDLDGDGKNASQDLRLLAANLGSTKSEWRGTPIFGVFADLFTVGAVQGRVNLPFPAMMEGFNPGISLRCGDHALTATSQPDGTFSIDNVPEGTCDVEVRAPAHLPAQRADVEVKGAQITHLPPVHLSIGDLNGDGNVDAGDLALLAVSFGRTESPWPEPAGVADGLIFDVSLTLSPPDEPPHFPPLCSDDRPFAFISAEL